jgi:hypothetical protein
VDTPARGLTLRDHVLLIFWLGKVLVIVGLVIWQLLFLLVRNPLDVRGEKAAVWPGPDDWPALGWAWQKLDETTTTYGNVLRIEQGWTLFTAPLARDGDFLAVRLVFPDGERVRIVSENEVNPSAFYFRRGGFRQRKLEDYLDTLASRQLDSPLLGAQVRARVAGWRRHHPQDGRWPERVELVRRHYLFPRPGDDPGNVVGPFEETLAVFAADGQPMPQDPEP